MKAITEQLTILIKSLGLMSFSGWDWLTYLSIMFITLLVVFAISRFYQRWLKQQQFTSPTLRSLHSSLRYYIIPFLLIFISTLYFYLALTELSSNKLIVYIHFNILITCFTLFMLRFLFFPNKDGDAIVKFNSINKKFYYRSFNLLILACVLYSFDEVLVALKLNNETSHVLTSLSVTLFVIFFIHWLFLFTKLGTLKKIDKLPTILNTAIYIIAASLVAANWLGYHLASLKFVYQLLFTLFAFFALLATFRAITFGITLLDGKDKHWQQQFRYYLGLKPHHVLSELFIYKIILQITLIIGLILTLAYTWGLSLSAVNNINNGLSNGFTVAGITIVPLRLAIALLTFATISVMGRMITASISHNARFAGELDTQNAMASITSYVMFGVAVLTAMIVSGINFTGIAIIAGALSVGVGLGLQNIVNNFVCGLILLIEKPIKPGDRIIIGVTEGIVQKVRIRSTQIKTRDRDDVIVPNSDLITQPVTNYMFRDRMFRIRIHVGVAYDSDVDFVKQLLHQIADDNDEVIKVAPNKPTVLFKAFGDSTLMFEMRCIITDANRKNFVLSDLNTEVWRRFRENNIEIAYPQRDVHIRSMPGQEKEGIKHIITPSNRGGNRSANDKSGE